VAIRVQLQIVDRFFRSAYDMFLPTATSKIDQNKREEN
jgi:hypothetical protein